MGFELSAELIELRAQERGSLCRLPAHRRSPRIPGWSTTTLTSRLPGRCDDRR